MKPSPNDKRQLPFGESTAVKDANVLSVINHTKLDLTVDLSDKFCEDYKNWIAQTTLNTIQGLDQFPFACYSNGTTEAFDKFYIKNHTRRFRCFRGEYVYHRLVWRNSWPNWTWLDDDCLDSNDAVVISLPFSDTGNKHKLHEALLEQCTEKGIPVLVDCAYFGICANIDFNFDHECITDITFSLSKVFPVANARIGMRLTRVDDDDSLFVSNKINYTNRFGAQLGLELINKFGPDYIFNKYRNNQLDLCLQHNVVASNTVLFGIGGKEWQDYNRGTETNRLSFNKVL
jgi:Aminotransferase class I and II